MLRNVVAVVCLLIFTGSAFAQEDLKIDQRKKGEGVVELVAKNTGPVPYTIQLNMKVKNMHLSRKLPANIVVPAGRQVVLLKLTQAHKRKGYSYEMSSKVALGNANNVKHDESYRYALPYRKGESYLMGQGYNGKFSHRGENALDFTMPKGTKVTAAREGVVARIKEDSNKGCKTKRCQGKANYVLIMHDDGTIGQYAHLKKKGALVDVGERVTRGQVIGLSGNTGYSSGPHLHFSVYAPSFGKSKSFKTRFRTKNSTGEYLREGKTYKSVN